MKTSKPLAAIATIMLLLVPIFSGFAQAAPTTADAPPVAMSPTTSSAPTAADAPIVAKARVAPPVTATTAPTTSTTATAPTTSTAPAAATLGPQGINPTTTRPLIRLNTSETNLELGAPSMSPAEWIRYTGAHKIAGYTAMVSAVAAATTAVLVPEYHPPVAATALGTALLASTLGAIGYWEYRDIAWPHFLLMGIAELGFAVNAFSLVEPGSTAHQIVGVGSLASMAAGYLAIRLIF